MTSHSHMPAESRSNASAKYTQFQWGRILLFVLLMIPIVVGAWIFQGG